MAGPWPGHGLGRGRRRLTRGLRPHAPRRHRRLVIGGVVFVAAAGLGGYGLARAALSPVERLRREVAPLSARDTEPGAPGAPDPRRDRRARRDA